MSFVLDKISYKVGEEVYIHEVSMSLEPGTMNVLLGPTLSGKTTLMRLMAGLDRPTAGRIVEAGQDVTGLAVRKRSVAMVYQQFVNYPTLSVYENIASPLRVEGLAKAEIEARVSRAAKLLRLEPMLGRTPSQLSGGQQQRTAIARALVKQARLVLLDEPLANLDYKLREELREELPRIFAETGAILVYATTEPSEALLLRGRTATLSQGRVTQVGPTAELYRQPDQPRCRAGVFGSAAERTRGRESRCLGPSRQRPPPRDGGHAAGPARRRLPHRFPLRRRLGGCVRTWAPDVPGPSWR